MSKSEVLWASECRTGIRLSTSKSCLPCFLAVCPHISDLTSLCLSCQFRNWDLNLSLPLGTAVKMKSDSLCRPLASQLALWREAGKFLRDLLVFTLQCFPRNQASPPHRSSDSPRAQLPPSPWHSFSSHHSSQPASKTSRPPWGPGRGKGKDVVPAAIHGTSRWPLLPFTDTVCVCGLRQREHCWLFCVGGYLWFPPVCLMNCLG